MNENISNIHSAGFLRDLESEVSATRKCIERIPKELFSWKPHDKSMEMGYLAVIVAEIPRWIAYMVEDGEIDFATWKRYTLTTTEDLVKYFDDNLAKAKEVLNKTADKTLTDEMFYLKMNGNELMKASKKDSVSDTLRHWVHHRGQLTVYMRLKDIAVPSIYGPSADEKTF